MRWLLLDDKKEDRSEVAAEKRKSAIHVLSSFRYVEKSRTARWWCRTDVMESLTQDTQAGKYTSADTWERVTAGVDAETGVNRLGLLTA